MHPSPLKQNDKVMLICPASPIDGRRIDEARDCIARLGFTPVLGKAVRKKVGYLAGSDQERLSDLLKGLTDPTIKMLFAIRGGYGSSRLLPALPPKMQSRKILCGFSDLTSLQCAGLRKNIFSCIHTPLNSLERPANRELFLKLVTSTTPPGSIAPWLSPTERRALQCVRKGSTVGKLIAANLSVLTSLVGTPYFPNLSNAILLLEEINEAPYRVDRLLTQLLQSGALAKVSGIGIGRFDTPPSLGPQARTKIHELIAERLSTLKIPLLFGVPFGHSGTQLPLPQGVKVRLNATKKTLEILESLVR